MKDHEVKLPRRSCHVAVTAGSFTTFQSKVIDAETAAEEKALARDDNTKMIEQVCLSSKPMNFLLNEIS